MVISPLCRLALVAPVTPRFEAVPVPPRIKTVPVVTGLAASVAGPMMRRRSSRSSSSVEARERASVVKEWFSGLGVVAAQLDH